MSKPQLQNSQKDEMALKLGITKLLQVHMPNYDGHVVHLELLTGTTNKVFKVISSNFKQVVFRYLSPIVDRNVQGRIVTSLSDSDVIPKCYYTCQTYRIEEYVENARHPSPIQIISDQKVLKAIVEKAHGFHQITIPKQIPKIDLISEMFSNQRLQIYQAAVPHQRYNVEEYKTLKKDLLKQFVHMKHWFEQNFKGKKQTIKFCHNDLNNLNIFIRDETYNQNNAGLKQKQAILIDFDYIKYNYVAYDIANLINETCFEYSGPYPGFKINRKLTREQISLACCYYDNKYENMEDDVLKMLVMVNYYWSFWSILIKPTSPDSAFCPLKHGMARWELVNYYKNNWAKI